MIFGPIGILMTGINGEKWFQVTDAAFTVLAGKAAMSKLEREYEQALHYMQVANRKYANLAFIIDTQQDRPDFHILRGGARIGLDVTDFSFRDRRSAAVRFRAVREGLISAYDRGLLRGCRGTGISFSFPDTKVGSDRRLAAEIPELVEMLNTIEVTEAHHAQFGKDWVRGVGPGPYPMGLEGSTKSGFIKWVVTGTFTGDANLAGADSFLTHCGFAVEHIYRQTVGLPQVKAELDRIVSKHDKADDQGIDELLIVAGGPDELGNSIPGDVSLVRWFITEGGKIAAPVRIKRIVLDCWGTDCLDVLYDQAASA